MTAHTPLDFTRHPLQDGFTHSIKTATGKRIAEVRGERYALEYVRAVNNLAANEARIADVRAALVLARRWVQDRADLAMSTQPARDALRIIDAALARTT